MGKNFKLFEAVLKIMTFLNFDHDSKISEIPKKASNKEPSPSNYLCLEELQKFYNPKNVLQIDKNTSF